MSAAPVATLAHQYMVTAPLEALDEAPLFPLIRDPDLRFYLRRERNAFLLGSYAHEGRPVWTDGVPEDFDHQLFPDDVEGMMPVFEAAASHVALLNAGSLWGRRRRHAARRARRA